MGTERLEDEETIRVVIEIPASEVRAFRAEVAERVAANAGPRKPRKHMTLKQLAVHFDVKFNRLQRKATTPDMKACRLTDRSPYEYEVATVGELLDKGFL